LKVKNRMSKDPVTIEPQASVDKALNQMRQHGVRHLPVMEKDQVVGLVTDIELRTAWFPSLLDELTVADVMVTNPRTIEAESSVYQAARIMVQNKLTGLLVMDQGHLVGIITLADILRVFVDVMGLLDETARLDVALRSGPQSLEEVNQLIRSHGGEVISVALLPSDPKRYVYSFRLEETNMAPIAAALREAGHEVLE